MSQKERNLPDDAADNFAEYDMSIDSFISNPAGPSTLQRVQGIEAEYAAQSAELRLLREKYMIDDTREELFEEMLESEVENAKNFVHTPEGEQYVRQTILKDWATLKGKPDDSISAFTRPQRERLRREYEKFYPPEEDE